MNKLSLNDVNGLIKSLRIFSQAYKRSCVLSIQIYEQLTKQSLKYGYLNWGAALISEMEDKNMEISFTIINEFLQMTYIKNLFKSYYEESDEEEKEGKSTKEKENSKRKHFIKYMKKLNRNAEEFTPTNISISKSQPNEEDSYIKKCEKNEQTIIYRKKLRNPSEVQEFTAQNSEKNETRPSMKDRINGKSSREFEPSKKF